MDYLNIAIVKVNDGNLSFSFDSYVEYKLGFNNNNSLGYNLKLILYNFIINNGYYIKD